MNTANHISPEDLALFALQCLPEDELKAAIDHMEHCEQCRTEVARLQGDLVTYAMTAEVHTPPAAARERLLRRVAKEKKIVPIAVQQQAAAAAPVEPTLTPRASTLFSNVEEMPVRRSMGMGAWLGWAVAAGVAVAGGLQFHQRQLLQSSLQAETAKYDKLSGDSLKAQMTLDALAGTGAFPVLMQPPTPDNKPTPKRPIAHVAYEADKGALVFVATNLDPLPAYKTYELWVIPTGGKDPIAAGTFKPDGNAAATVIMPDIPTGVTAAAFGVTIEDDGGSKTPTAPLVLKGE